MVEVGQYYVYTTPNGDITDIICKIVKIEYDDIHFQDLQKDGSLGGTGIWKAHRFLDNHTLAVKALKVIYVD